MDIGLQYKIFGKLGQKSSLIRILVVVRLEFRVGEGVFDFRLTTKQY